MIHSRHTVRVDVHENNEGIFQMEEEITLEETSNTIPSQDHVGTMVLANQVSLDQILSLSLVDEKVMEGLDSVTTFVQCLKMPEFLQFRVNSQNIKIPKKTPIFRSLKPNLFEFLKIQDIQQEKPETQSLEESNVKSKNDSQKSEKKVVTFTNKQVIVEESFVRLDILYKVAEKLSKNGKSEDYSEVVREAEEEIERVKQAQKEDPTVCKEEDIKQAENKVNQLYLTIPKGPSVLTLRDEQKLRDIFIKPPEGAKYKTDFGEFCVPTITAAGLATYFADFCEAWGYSGISVNMRTQKYYDLTDKEKLFTAITFKKKPISIGPELSRLWSYVSFDRHDREKIQRLKNGDEFTVLNSLIKFKEWGFSESDGCKLGLLSTYFSNLPKEILNEYGYFIFLYHKKA